MNRYKVTSICMCGSDDVILFEEGVYRCSDCGEFFEDDVFSPREPLSRNKVRSKDEDDE